MANRGPAYGLSRDCQLKTVAKFDLCRAKEALQWIEEVNEEEFEPSSGNIKDQFDVKSALKNGQALCKLMNRIHPGSIKKVNNSKLAFKEMENIEFFLRACKGYGMNEVDCFQTQDLYESKSMYSVINCLYQLGSLARKHDFDGPTIGVKLADKNERRFSEEQVVKGKMLINLQYGSNQGASQRGMTPYGATRKM